MCIRDSIIPRWHGSITSVVILLSLIHIFPISTYEDTYLIHWTRTVLHTFIQCLVFRSEQTRVNVPETTQGELYPLGPILQPTVISVSWEILKPRATPIHQTPYQNLNSMRAMPITREDVITVESPDTLARIVNKSGINKELISQKTCEAGRTKILRLPQHQKERYKHWSP